MHRWRSERGAGTLENLGVVMIAAILIVAVILAFAGFKYGDQLAAALCRVTAAVSGGDGGSCGTVAPDPKTSKDDQQAWAFVDEAPEGGGNTNGVTIVAGPAQESDMVTQAENSVTTAERSMGATDGSAEAFAWPGAADAAYGTYTVTMPVGSEDGEKARFESLGVKTEDGQQAVVLAYGPQASYEDGQVHEILASVTVR